MTENMESLFFNSNEKAIGDKMDSFFI